MENPGKDERIAPQGVPGQDLGLVTVATVSVLAGVATGAGAAELLRRRGLAWTWTLLSVPLFPVAAGLLFLSDAAPISLGLAAFSAGLPFGAIVWSLRRRIDDHRAGGDRASEAAERRGLRDALRARRPHRSVGRAASRLGGIPLGRTGRGALAAIRRGTHRSGSHVLIPGATGAGKTTSLAALLVEYVVRSRFGAVVLEAKTDTALSATAAMAARSRGCGFHLVSPHGVVSYDPLQHGSVDERAERLIAVESWGTADADFYRQAASPFLRLAIRALDAAGEPATLRTVASACDPHRLENLAGRIGDQALATEILDATDALRADERRAVAGLRARLRNLADSEFARSWLDPASASGPHLDLRDALHNREIVYFRLDTDRTGNVGKAIAQMVLLDLGAAASAAMGRGTGTFVAIDEFGALEAPALERLYTRGRSAGISVAVGTQTVADLREAGPAVRERVGATIDSIVCHRIGNQADAEWIAQLIGTVPTWETTTRTDALGLPTDEGTRTRGHRFEVHPSRLQRLGCGEAFVARLDRAGRSRADRARIVPPWKRLPPATDSPQPTAQVPHGHPSEPTGQPIG